MQAQQQENQQSLVNKLQELQDQIQEVPIFFLSCSSPLGMAVEGCIPPDESAYFRIIPAKMPSIRR